MSLLDESRRDHTAILAAAAALKTAIQAGPPVPDLGRLRINLATVVRSHLAKQQTLLAELKPDFCDRMDVYDRVMKQDRDLRLDYSRHIMHWDSKLVERDFASYEKDVCVMIARLNRYLKSLEANIYEPALKMRSWSAG